MPKKVNCQMGRPCGLGQEPREWSDANPDPVTQAERKVIAAAEKLFDTWQRVPWNDRFCRIAGDKVFIAVRALRAEKEKRNGK